MRKDDIAENVLKQGKEGVKQNIIEALDEFCDEYADEMYRAVEEIIRLRAENAALRERLSRAVELPCKVGDTVYKVYGECNGSDCPYNGAFGQWRCNYKGKDRCKAFIDTIAFRYSDISSINKTIFVSKEAAEARLAELKGEKNG